MTLMDFIIVWGGRFLIGFIIGALLVIFYDQIKHRRLIKKYELEKTTKGTTNRSGGIKGTGADVTKQDFPDGQTDSKAIHSKFDGTTADGEQKNSKYTRNPFKRRRK